jgi:curli biogenesis system outer membrane secretion channel CsgG
MRTLTAIASLVVSTAMVCAQEPKVVRAIPVAPAAAGPMLKKRIAVTHFDNKSNWQGQIELGTGFADALADALVKCGRFIVVERAEIQNVMKEQDFAVSGRTADTATGPKIGQLLTAQIQITGSILSVDTRTSDGGAGFGFKGFNIGASGGTAQVDIALRVIDTSSGQVLDSQQIKGIARKQGLAFGFTSGDFRGGLGGLKKTPLGDAVVDALNQAVNAISSRLEQVPWQGRIVKADGDRIYINAGSNFGVKPGDRFTCFHPGEALIDPETGLNLGGKTTKYGQIEVVEVSDKFSIAKPTGGTGFAGKDIIKIE